MKLKDYELELSEKFEVWLQEERRAARQRFVGRDRGADPANRQDLPPGRPDQDSGSMRPAWGMTELEKHQQAIDDLQRWADAQTIASKEMQTAIAHLKSRRLSSSTAWQIACLASATVLAMAAILQRC